MSPKSQLKNLRGSLAAALAGLLLPTIHASAGELELSPTRGLDAEFDNGIRFSAGARVQADAARFSDDVTDLEDDNDFRRARLSTTLDWSSWRLRADYDFGVSEGWKNLFLQYRGLRKKRITVGNQVAPFSMEDLTSSYDLPLMERSVASALNPGTLLGASYRTWGDRWSIQAGVFGDELSELDRRRMPGKSVNARFTYAPVRNEATTLHLGAAAERRRVDDGEDVRLRARPGTRLTNRRLVNTRRIEDVASSTTAGIELAAAYRNMRVQSEVTRTVLEQSMGDLSFDSRYVMASVVIGGKPYRYSHSRGTFRAARADSEWGAVELAARVARLDLSDGMVSGGKQLERTLGVTWIHSRHTRVMLNYTDIEASPNRNGDDEDVSLVSLRLQFAM